MSPWAWGLPLIVLTVVIHVFCLLYIVQKVDRAQNALAGRYSYDAVSAMVVGAMSLLAASLHGIEAMIWASTYRFLGALPDYKSAALYSLSAMTSYGHASVFLEQRWQLMGALEALNGVLLFGLTTAFLIDTIQRARAFHREGSP
jgi:hypothetical protein